MLALRTAPVPASVRLSAGPTPVTRLVFRTSSGGGRALDDPAAARPLYFPQRIRAFCKARGGLKVPVSLDTTGRSSIPTAAATIRNGTHSGYGINAGIPNSGSPPPSRRTSDTKNATIDPTRFAFGSNNAQVNCGTSRTNTRSLVKNHSACTLCTRSAIATDAMPRATMVTRTTSRSVVEGRSGRSHLVHAFQLNIALADRMDDE